jgi:hypothetical protein
MDEVLTASVLPRTQTNINGLLSIVFLGPGRFNPNVRTVSMFVPAKLAIIETRQPVIFCVKFGLDGYLVMACCMVYRMA